MDSIARALAEIDRRHFVLPQYADVAHEDRPLPIGHGQTISQPSTVRNMLEWLDPQPGDKVLDIGSGSGWTTALLGHIVGPKGKVYAVEIIPELVEMGRVSYERLGMRNATFFHAGDHIGLPEYAPYDRILVSAAADEMPEELLDQLSVFGKLVIPIHNSIYELTRTEHDWQQREHFGFAFVPLIT